MTTYRITSVTATVPACQSVSEFDDFSSMYNVVRAMKTSAAFSSILVERNWIDIQDSSVSWTVYEDNKFTPEQLTQQRKLLARIANEQKAVKKVVESAIRLGYMVSLFDGEEWSVKRSTDKKLIMANVYATDMDKIQFRNKVTGESVGFVLFIYGNCASEVINDHTDTDEVATILADAQAFCDKLSAKGE